MFGECVLYPPLWLLRMDEEEARGDLLGLLLPPPPAILATGVTGV